jgi:hypothetical protein
MVRILGLVTSSLKSRSLLSNENVRSNTALQGTLRGKAAQRP